MSGPPPSPPNYPPPAPTGYAAPPPHGPTQPYPGQGWQTPPQMGYPQPPPQPKSHTGIYVAVAVIFVVVVLGGAALAYENAHPSSSGSGNNSPPQTVVITATNLNPQGGNGNCWTSSTGTGGTIAAGSDFSTSWTLSYPGGLFKPASCTVQSASVQTPGFTIVSSNAPLTVSAGGTQTLTVVLGTPSTDYTGTVTLELTVTAP
jgi:hypothetical protein